MKKLVNETIYSLSVHIFLQEFNENYLEYYNTNITYIYLSVISSNDNLYELPDT